MKEDKLLNLRNKIVVYNLLLLLVLLPCGWALLANVPLRKVSVRCGFRPPPPPGARFAAPHFRVTRLPAPAAPPVSPQSVAESSCEAKKQQFEQDGALHRRLVVHASMSSSSQPAAAARKKAKKTGEDVQKQKKVLKSKGRPKVDDANVELDCEESRFVFRVLFPLVSSNPLSNLANPVQKQPLLGGGRSISVPLVWRYAAQAF